MGRTNHGVTVSSNSNKLSRQSSTESASNYNWSTENDEDNELSLCSMESCSSSNNKNDFLLKYLNAQNNYLQSIWYDGIALLEYSLQLLQKQQLEQQRIRHEQQQQDNWNHLAEDLYDNDDDDGQSPLTPIGGNHNGGLFVLDPATNQPAQIPGLWYIEMHLANCYHTWGQSNMALYHINRTLDQLGNYKINPDSLTVQLNTRRKFKL